LLKINNIAKLLLFIPTVLLDVYVHPVLMHGCDYIRVVLTAVATTVTDYIRVVLTAVAATTVTDYIRVVLTAVATTVTDYIRVVLTVVAATTVPADTCGVSLMQVL